MVINVTCDFCKMNITKKPRATLVLHLPHNEGDAFKQGLEMQFCEYCTNEELKKALRLGKNEN